MFGIVKTQLQKISSLRNLFDQFGAQAACNNIHSLEKV